MNLNYTAIVTMIMNKEPLQSILDVMATYLKSAVIFINDNMEIIAHSTTVTVRDPYWIQALDQGFCSDEMLSKIYNNPFVKQLPRFSSITSGNSYPPDNITLKYYITLPSDTFHCHTTVLALPLENRFEKQQQDLLLSFAGLVRNTYLRTEQLPLAYKYRGYKNILQKILDWNYEYSLEIEGKEGTSDDSIFIDNVRALVISPEFQESSDAILYSLTNRICSILENDYATIYNGSVVTISSAHELTEPKMAQLLQLANQSNSKIGISWQFSGKEKFRIHYNQAVFSIKMARELNMTDWIYTYDDMYIYELINHCQKKDYWSNTEHPVQTLLKHYDKEHASSLYDTLYCLLKCGMNSALTAKKLNIHKSTFYHRLEVLKNLIPGLMTKNSEWQTSVMLSFDLARLSNNT